MRSRRRRRRLSLLNYNFVAIPHMSCATPHATFYAKLNGITVGVAAFLAWMAALWVVGRAVARARALPHAAVREFDRSTLAKLVTFLTIACAPAPPPAPGCRITELSASDALRAAVSTTAGTRR